MRITRGDTFQKGTQKKISKKSPLSTLRFFPTKKHKIRLLPPETTHFIINPQKTKLFCLILLSPNPPPQLSTLSICTKYSAPEFQITGVVGGKQECKIDPQLDSRKLNLYQLNSHAPTLSQTQISHEVPAQPTLVQLQVFNGEKISSSRKSVFLQQRNSSLLQRTGSLLQRTKIFCTEPRSSCTEPQLYCKEPD